MGFTRVSPQLAGFDSDTSFFSGAYNPRRTSETYVEATYQRQLTPWLQIQPDVQFVFNPGGGIANPQTGNSRVGNELVAGLRANILL
jgi:porin